MPAAVPDHQTNDRNEPLLAEYGRDAARYDTRWADYLCRTTRAVLDRLDAQPGERILDVGCGTGLLLERLRLEVPDVRLVGVDPVPEMLTIARRRLPMPATADLREAAAERLPFADRSFDAVVSASVFHYVRRPETALAEMRRVLRPGGRLVLTDWSGDFLTCRLIGVYLRLRRRALHRIYRRQELRRLLAGVGFKSVDIELYRAGWCWGMWLARAGQPGNGTDATGSTGGTARE